MKGRKNILSVMLMLVVFVYSCGRQGEVVDNKENRMDTVLQDPDGTISLKVAKADCYHDMSNPKSNTAEWNVKVLKSGRYNVWLSTATKDTTDLKYNNKVLLNIHENQIEGRPKCDKVILNSSDVNYPYFRADSFMGSLYIKDTGVFNIQVISDRIVPGDYKESHPAEDLTMLLSVFFTPELR